MKAADDLAHNAGISARSIKVAAAQLGPPDADRVVTIRRMVHLLRSAAGAGARIVAYPELALTRYFADRPFPGLQQSHKMFQDLPDDATRCLFEEADELGVHLVLPFAEWAGGRRFNSALVWQARRGVLGTYRKVHVPEPVEFIEGSFNAYESEWFTAGDEFPVFELPEARIGIQICFDRHFPESTRCLALTGAEIVFLCSNSQSYGKPWRVEVWKQICSMRAYENTVFFVASNKVGLDGQMDMHGSSCVVSPRGEILAIAPKDGGDTFIVADLDLGQITAERRYRRFLVERRPAVYGALAVSGQNAEIESGSQQ